MRLFGFELCSYKPWKKFWKEYKEGKEIYLTWHRKEIE